ncbi:hypothetical protein N9K75_01610 [bacterium]|nr:hypothetical protein [bacterium]
MDTMLPLHLSYEFWVNFRHNTDTSTEGMVGMLNFGYNKINWRGLCGNRSEGAMVFLMSNPEKIVWDEVSKNPSKHAEAVLRSNVENIDMHALSSNIGDWSSNLLRETAWHRCMIFKEDLMKNRFHPENAKYKDWGFWGNEYDEYEYELPLPTISVVVDDDVMCL